MKTNVAVIFGCRSVEHEVSIISAVQAMRSADTEKYDLYPVYVAKNGDMYTGKSLFEIEEFSDIDALLKKCEPITLVRQNGRVVIKFLNSTLFKKKEDIELSVAFPIVHGTNCEDGTLAGMLEFLGLPYVGCDTLSAAIGMNKAVFKDVLSAAGLPVLKCVTFSSREYSANAAAVIENIKSQLKFPLIVKPVNLGSSVGISKATDEASLTEAIELAVSFADVVLVERAVENLREINCSVLGNFDTAEASVLEEPIMHDEILSYKDKYMGNSKSKGMASLGRKIPAEISEEKSAEIRELSVKIFKVLGCNGVVRIDFLMDSVTGEVFANEINTIPGSLAFYLWDATGVNYTALIDKLIELAFQRARARDNLTFTINTNILSGISFGGAKGSKGGN